MKRKVKGERTLAELEAAASRRAGRARVLLSVLLGVGAFLILINALALPAQSQMPLVARWWSITVVLALVALAAVVAARELWLLPRELAARRWLVAARPLYAPLAAARAAEERILEGRAAPLTAGREELAALLETPREGVETAEFKRRAARLDAYRVALATLEIEALLDRELFGSAGLAPALDRAAELLQAPQEQPATAAPAGSIAVLPFTDLSPLRDQEHLSYGLAEVLIDALTKLQRLRVIARGLAFSFAGQELEVREIGRRLGVDSVLEGSVRKSGDRLHLTVRLVAIGDDRELWSGTFDEPIAEIFRIEEELARGVVQALGLTPSRAERRALEKPATRVAGAYESYLRGRKFAAQFRSRGMEFALEMFNRAIELDGGFTLAHAGVADCCAFLYANAGRSEDHRLCALEASARALELDPELPQAHLARGVALSQGGRPEEAGRSFEAAIRLSPNLFEAHYFYARHLFAAGEPEEAMRYYESAARLRPEDYQGPLLSAQIYDDLGRPEEATALRRRGIGVAREHLKLNPDDARALYMGANGMVSVGETEEGLKWARRSRELEPQEPMLLYNLACIYSLAGETDEALECLAAGIENGFSYRDWVEHDSNLDAIRDHPTFGRLMEKL